MYDLHLLVAMRRTSVVVVYGSVGELRRRMCITNKALPESTQFNQHLEQKLATMVLNNDCAWSALLPFLIIHMQLMTFGDH